MSRSSYDYNFYDCFKPCIGYFHTKDEYKKKNAKSIKCVANCPWHFCCDFSFRLSVGVDNKQKESYPKIGRVAC